MRDRSPMSLDPTGTAPRPANAPAVTVIVVAYNAGRFLQPCIDSLAAQTFSDLEVVIVDNASTDRAARDIVLPDGRFRVKHSDRNLGFAAANNLAARVSRSAWIATLNPDTLPEPAWLENLMAATRRWGNVAAFGSTQVSLDEPDLLDGVGDVWHAVGLAWRAYEGRSRETIPEEGETFAVCAAGGLYRTDVFKDLGGFDEAFFCYCEDVDLSFRIRSRGWGLVQVPDAVLAHAGSGTTGKASDFTIFYGHRNRVWTFVKNTPGWLFWLMIPAHIALNLRMLQKAPTAEQAEAMKRAYVAAWRGIGPVLKARRDEQRSRRVPVLDMARMFVWRPRKITTRDRVTDADGRSPRWLASRLV